MGVLGRALHNTRVKVGPEMEGGRQAHVICLISCRTPSHFLSLGLLPAGGDILPGLRIERWGYHVRDGMSSPSWQILQSKPTLLQPPSDDACHSKEPRTLPHEKGGHEPGGSTSLEIGPYDGTIHIYRCPQVRHVPSLTSFLSSQQNSLVGMKPRLPEGKWPAQAPARTRPQSLSSPQAVCLRGAHPRCCKKP